MYKLKAARVNKGIKQKDFAEQIGISAQYLCSIERCSTEPRRDLMIKIAKALNSSVQELFFSDEGAKG